MIPPVFALTNIREFDIGVGQQLLHRLVFPFGKWDLSQVQDLQCFADVGNGVGEHKQWVAPRIDGDELMQVSNALRQSLDHVARDDERAQVGEITEGFW